MASVLRKIQKTKMKAKINNWRECSINNYIEIRDIMSDETLSDYEKEVKTIAVICDVDEDEIWNLSINEFRDLQVGKLWIGDFKIDTSKHFRKIKLNDTEYEVDIDLQNMTVAQYIDFQTFWAQRDDITKIGNLLAVFVIPKGCKYNEGYDIKKTIDDIMDYMDIMTANEIVFFFLSSYAALTRVMLHYLTSKMKRMAKRKKMDQDRMMELQKQVDQLEKAILDGFHSLSK